MLAEIKKVTLKNGNWPNEMALLVTNCIAEVLKKKTECNIALTGGRNAEYLYHAWSNLEGFSKSKRINFYLGDERFSPKDYCATNEKTIMNSLFKNGIPGGCKFLPILNYDCEDIAITCEKYQEIFPDKVDILLITPGVDGHIASIFPGDNKVFRSSNKIEFTNAKYRGSKRISITPKVILNSENIYVMCPTEEKYKVIIKALSDTSNPSSYPVVLVRGGIIIACN